MLTGDPRSAGPLAPQMYAPPARAPLVGTRSSGMPWKVVGTLGCIAGMACIIVAPTAGGALLFGGFVVFIVGRFHDG